MGRVAATAAPDGANLVPRPAVARGSAPAPRGHSRTGGEGLEDVPSDTAVPIEMEGDGPLVVRQKFHQAIPIPIDQALYEMELVGHDFYLFHDVDEDMPSVVYRRHGYQYGVIRLVEGSATSRSTHQERAASAPVAAGRRGAPASPPG